MVERFSLPDVQKEERNYLHNLQVTLCDLFFYACDRTTVYKRLLYHAYCMRFIMKFSESLKSNSDFKNVYSRGKSYANKYLVMYVLENGTDKNRLGISVSKKVGNSVVRHHVTRLIREGYRLHEDMFNSGLDMVVVARVSAKDATYSEIESALLHVSRLHKNVLI